MRNKRRRATVVVTAIAVLAVIKLTGAVDQTPPPTPTVRDGGAYTSSSSSLHANWTSFDPESRVSTCMGQIREGSAAGRAIATRFMTCGTFSAATFGGLTLRHGESYYWAVAAQNLAGLWSEVGVADGIKVDLTPPSAPQSPTENDLQDADYDTDGNYTVFWLPADDAESQVITYELQERAASSSTWMTLSAAIAGGSFAVTGRQGGETYYYRVRARNGAGTVGNFSSASDGIMIASQPPAVTALTVSNITSASALISWTTTEAASCTVRCATSSSSSTQCALTANGTVHEAVLSSLASGTTYEVGVACTDLAGNRGEEALASFTTSTSGLGPSEVAVRGRQLWVRRRRADGTLAPATPYVIRGVNWSPASRNTATSPTSSDNVQVRRPEFGRWYQTDIALLKAMNVNTVRLFMDPGLPGDTNVIVPGRTVLDELHANGIMAIITVDNGNNSVSRIGSVVAHYRDHPAVLMWSLGSEWNINRFWKPGQFPTVESAAMAIESAAQLVKSLDSLHPVVSSYGSIVNKPNDIESYVSRLCPSVDVWSLNEYRGPGFGQLFQQWRFISDKPMFVGEFGIDAFNSLTQQEDQATQAEWGGRLWDEILRNLSADDPDRVALGGTLFSFVDEHWKSGTWWVQDKEGWSPIAFPDRVASEDWWGAVNIDRAPRELYSTLATRFADGYRPPPPPRAVTYRAESLYTVWTRFWENGALMYDGRGASINGSRGFIIAVIDPATGLLRDAIQRFDTWLSRNSGSDMIRMIDYLNSVPDGLLLLIAVGDEAGLNAFSSCQRLSYPWVETALQRLEALGATQLRSYCYGDQWSFLGIRGQGVALSEALGRGTAHAEATTTITIP